MKKLFYYKTIKKDLLLKKTFNQKILNISINVDNLILTEEELLIWQKTTKEAVFLKQLDTYTDITNLAVNQTQKDETIFNISPFKWKTKDTNLNNTLDQVLFKQRDLVFKKNKYNIPAIAQSFNHLDTKNVYTLGRLIKPLPGGYLLSTDIENTSLGFISTKHLNTCLRWLLERNTKLNNFYTRIKTNEIIFSQKSIWPILPALETLPLILWLKARKFRVLTSRFYKKNLKPTLQQKYIRSQYRQNYKERQFLKLQMWREAIKYGKQQDWPKKIMKDELMHISYKHPFPKYKWQRIKRRRKKWWERKKQKEYFFKLYFYHYKQPSVL